MPARTTGLARLAPQRSRLPAPALPSRRAELTAALAIAALLTELVVAPVALLITLGLVAVGRATRWRPHWLAIPAGVGLTIAAAIGARRAVAGFTAGPRELLGDVGRAGQLLRLSAALSAAVHLMPRQVPVGLVAGAAQAGLVLWLGWWRPAAVRGTSQAWWRPGLLAAIRRRRTRIALGAGRSVTASGCALGVEVSTGHRAELSWAEAERSVLACCADPADLADVCLLVLSAAIRRRKAVVAANLSDGPWLGAACAQLSGRFGVPLIDIGRQGPGQDGAAAALGQAIRRREVALATAETEVLGGLATVLRGLRELGLQADTLAWIHGCEAADPAVLSALTELGPGTGTCLLMSTTSAAAAARLALAVEVVIAAGPIGPDLAQQLTARLPVAIDKHGAIARPANLTLADGADQHLVGAFPAQTASRQAAAQALVAQRAGTFAILSSARPRPVTVGCATVAQRLVSRP